MNRNHKAFASGQERYALATVSASAANGERIRGGKPCSPHSQPWQAALFTGFRLRCGGTLINKSWVLSAAHCKATFPFFVRLGEHNLRRLDWSEQLKLTSKVIVHPDYNPVTKNNDIMLIKLLLPACLNSKVQTLELPTHCPVPGNRCVVSGWGTTSSPQGISMRTWYVLVRWREAQILARATRGVPLSAMGSCKGLCPGATRYAHNQTNQESMLMSANTSTGSEKP
ncbi:kallikrein-15-like isoform X2 [Hemicordylus capensis]|uniref:kallikrein-15-like isoform X2 n=1 Tax=Hemicordylus capensis TaxID=884348 RepID=UPI002302D7D6|nr:kallikrein-15-like isoform X2 [Hemicordylus capensis]